MGIITVDTRARKPIYEQLVENIKGLVLSGLLAPNAQLPSVRSLAVELAINPNTIQKSYAELERSGIIYSIPGRGSFVSDDLAALSRANREQTAASLCEALESAKSAGITKEDALAMLTRIFDSPKPSAPSDHRLCAPKNDDELKEDPS